MSLFKSSKNSVMDYPFITPEEENHFKVLDDMKCVSQNARNLLQNVIKEDKRKCKRLEKYKNKMRGPEWYKELTEKQVAATNLIFSALRKDALSYQLIRIRHVLSGIGILPFPNKEQLIKAIEFSRNSDLAFLWYLYDSVYRTSSEICTQRKYSYNERVILSCICHLDMLLTLRELDKILPKQNHMSIKTFIDVKKKKTKYSHLIPPRPVPPLDIYDMYKDPFYIIENESNRWFADESLISTKSHCVAQNVLEKDFLKNFCTFSCNKNNLCTKHKNESSKSFQIMKVLIQGEKNIDFDEKGHGHQNIRDRGIAYGVHVEFQKCKQEFNQKLESEINVKTLLHQIVDNSFNQRFLHFCRKCETTSISNEKNLISVYEKDDYDDIHQYHSKIPKSSSYNPLINKYFQSPSIDGSHPLKFDYERIFSIDFLHDHGVVKNSINTALKLNKYSTVDNAITTCLRDMWQMKIKNWNEKRQVNIEERQHRVVADFHRIGKDKEKIFKLLREAITIMKRNKKFVLAALPQCYRLPILKEWILQRYGIKYINDRSIKCNKGEDRKYT